MASTGTPTPNYGLNQWRSSDTPERVDFNSDNWEIDEALNELNSKVTGVLPIELLPDHNHDTEDITSGRLSQNRMPTSGTANRVLRVGTASTDPVYAQVNLATDVTGILPAINGFEIPENTNLNNLVPPGTLPGNYFCRQNAIAVTVQNRPPGFDQAFSLQLIRWGNDHRVMQIAMTIGIGNNARIAFRNAGDISGQWGAWQEVARLDANGKLPIANLPTQENQKRLIATLTTSQTWTVPVEFRGREADIFMVAGGGGGGASGGGGGGTRLIRNFVLETSHAVTIGAGSFSSHGGNTVGFGITVNGGRFGGDAGGPGGSGGGGHGGNGGNAGSSVGGVSPTGAVGGSGGNGGNGGTNGSSGGGGSPGGSGESVFVSTRTNVGSAGGSGGNGGNGGGSTIQSPSINPYDGVMYSSGGSGRGGVGGSGSGTNSISGANGNSGSGNNGSAGSGGNFDSSGISGIIHIYA